ncbi:MAG: hydrogenase maturation nickel metallochaperone HypA [Candidatus Auribacterota bacterium]|nr:hydrogenase maturation nickel metallochaperone HypA [Candidatus Auribacterota bacterium]
MHEWSIADNLVKLIVPAAEREELSSVSRVVIRVGVLQQIVPESLELAFDMLSRETVISGAELRIEMIPLRARCRACGIEFGGTEFAFTCPDCGKIDPEIISGKELYIDYIEGEKETPNSKTPSL